MRAAERIALRVSDVTASRKSKWARGRTRCKATVVQAGEVDWRSSNLGQLLVQGADWSKPEKLSVHVRQTGMERVSGKDIRTAVTHIIAQIGNLAAMTESWSKGQTAAPVGRVGNLPATNQEIGGSADVAHILLSAPNGQL